MLKGSVIQLPKLQRYMLNWPLPSVFHCISNTCYDKVAGAGLSERSLRLDYSRTSVLPGAQPLSLSSNACIQQREPCASNTSSIEAMAPLPGNEADHLREKARRDLLDLLESVSLFTYCFADVY